MVRESVIRKTYETAEERYRAFGIDTNPAFDKMKLPECTAKQTVMSCLIPVREPTSGQLDEPDRFMGRSKRKMKEENKK